MRMLITSATKFSGARATSSGLQHQSYQLHCVLPEENGLTEARCPAQIPKKGPKKQARSVCHLHRPGSGTTQQRECSHLYWSRQCQLQGTSLQDTQPYTPHPLPTDTPPHWDFTKWPTRCNLSSHIHFLVGGKWTARLRCFSPATTYTISTVTRYTGIPT